MLELKKITKVYHTGGFEQKALNSVSLSFRKSEFASILGPSGSGKTTLLNIIGGLDSYTSGDLLINEVSTKRYNDAAWDSYRNHRVGFVFQSYNLIPHQSVLSNVRLALTVSGLSKREGIRRAKQALQDVGLSEHIHKRPAQLSGGQMQRVAIARALVNDPDIVLADEPTGALDTETSIQIMEILKRISKTRLVILVTHNPELAKKYSTRIINLKDGKITSDSRPFNGKDKNLESQAVQTKKRGRASMSLLTAFSLSANNLLTKKKRTILVSFAASIGIIGIALIMAVSTGFQNYVDSIQEETLTSYPLRIMEESFSLENLLVTPDTGGDNSYQSKLDRSGKDVIEFQFLADTLRSVATNDLKSFKHYLEENSDKYKDDVTSIEYSYAVDPTIYTVDATDTLVKLNPSNLFSSMFGGSQLMSSFSSYSSIFSQITEDRDALEAQYELKAGRWPERYNEMVIVLSSERAISDLLAYSLGLKDTAELTTMVTKLMSGESVDIQSEPLTMDYEDFLDLDMRLILPFNLYKYNERYGVYEDMSDDKGYIKTAYDKALKLKITGVVFPKNGSFAMLEPGVGYMPSLIEYIIDSAKQSEVVKKQLADDSIDVFSGARFDQDSGRFDYSFDELVSVDSEKLANAFNINIDESDVASKVQEEMYSIQESITADITPAKTKLAELLEKYSKELFYSVDTTMEINYGTEETPNIQTVRVLRKSDIDQLVENYLQTYDAATDFSKLEEEYHLPKSIYQMAFSGILKSLLEGYISASNSFTPEMLSNPEAIQSLLGPTSETKPLDDDAYAIINEQVIDIYLRIFLISTPITTFEEQLAIQMTELKVKLEVMQKVASLATTITDSFAKSFNIDPSAITSAFTLNFTEDELMRVVSAMLNKTDSSAKGNLLSLGYQDLEDPSYISVYFSSFDGKENFIKFINDYNEKVKREEHDDQVINFADATGILMDSVKVIVDAVSYVLIAFVSISLIVSSIMIGVITYISVFERTKEIGILRAIGASKHNISSIFNAETAIIGFLSGLIGIGISYLTIPLINAILIHLTGNSNIAAALPIQNALSLILLSIILTLVGGFIPARSAAKKDPVEALRTE